MILSGGVDTGAVVCAAAEAGVQVTAAITVLTSEAATDRPYAEAIAKALGIKHYPINISLPELLNRQLPACVRALQTFDGMELRNAIVVSEALHKAAELGFGTFTKNLKHAARSCVILHCNKCDAGFRSPEPSLGKEVILYLSRDCL